MIVKNYNFKKSESPRFIIDSDQKMIWLSQFDSSNYNRIFVVIDEVVNKKYRSLIFNNLKMHRKIIYDFKITSLEKEKNINTAFQIINEFENNLIGRFDLVVAVGGGFIFDVVSFVCSIYMRGIPFFAVPTTLIGQVDAATAGKTCLNGNTTKNLLGTYYFAKITYNNTYFLQTLNPYDLRQGLSEIFKYGLLGSIKLIKYLNSYILKRKYDKIESIIEETIRVRVKIRKIDPLASNLGHTFGHAFEKFSNYKIGHGDAISIGTLLAIKFGERENITTHGLYEDVKKKMVKLGLNIKYSTQWNPDEISKLMLKDKKSSSKQINLVLLRDYSKPFFKNESYFYSVSAQKICEFIDYYFKSFKEDKDEKLFHNLRY
jgi:3-dehydroquinate synthase